MVKKDTNSSLVVIERLKTCRGGVVLAVSSAIASTVYLAENYADYENISIPSIWLGLTALVASTYFLKQCSSSYHELMETLERIEKEKEKESDD